MFYCITGFFQTLFLGIYDYDATGSDEISFRAGDKIKILNRVPNGVEDGWWKGSSLWDEGQRLNVFVHRILKPDFSM